MSDDGFDKIRDQLDIEVVGISHVVLFRTAVSQQVDGVDRVGFLQKGEERRPLMTAGTCLQVVDQEQRLSASGSGIKYVP